VLFRRWAIWSARLALLGGLVGSAWGVWVALGDEQGRQWLVMSGLAGAVFIALFLIWAHEATAKVDDVVRTRLARRAMTFGTSCVALGVFLAGQQADAVHVITKAAHLPQALSAVRDVAGRLAIHHDHVALLPRFSAKMSGATQAPVSLIFLGSGAELLEAFTRARWHAAGRLTPRSALRAFGRGLLNKPYFTAPVFPSFLDGRLHDVAFQRTDDGGSSRRRHHARWWLTDFICEGKQVWVATASYDAGVGLGRIFPMPIHHIDPDIDAERDYIVRSLTESGGPRVTQEVRITEPMTGRNAAGDLFHTQGMAFVLA
jgi:hypothetical protein